MKKLKLSIFLIIIAFSAKGQDIQKLELKDVETSEILNLFELSVSEKDAKKILASHGRKIRPEKASLLYNSDTLNIKSVKTRGRSSLNFRRKSISVSLKEPLNIQGVEIKKFALVGMVMDKNYWRNRFSFTMLDQFGLFPLFNTYTEFRINGSTQGIYLLIQKAEDYTKAINSPILIRREYDDKFSVEYSKGQLGADKKKVVENGKKLPGKYQGKELSDTISSLLDLNRYYRWLAFNYLVMNGDYTDEVFFYFDTDTELFKIIPWDYDDVFSSQPHEGWNQQRTSIQHGMLYSGEAYLDRIIDGDPFLYRGYLNEFSIFIKQFKESEIRSVFQQIYAELYPYYIQPEIIGQSSHDQSGLTDLENLKKDMQEHFSFLMLRTQSTKAALDEEKANSSQ